MADPTRPRTSERRDRRKSKSNTRLLMIAGAFGALLVLVISAALNWPVGGNDAGIGASGKQGAAPAPPPVFEASPGTCLNWTEPDADDIRQVTCAEPHLFEVTGKDDLKAQFGDSASFPNTEQWQQLKQTRCAGVSRQYLSGRFDTHGRFSVGAFTPSVEGWDSGDRTLHCGVQQPGPSGKLYRINGSAAQLDQSNTYDEGRCLGINGGDVWDPIDCGEQHSVEITGKVDLGEQFRGAFPAEPEQDGFLAPKCRELTARYAGGPAAAENKGLTAYWDNLSQQSWEAGSRQVNCKVSAQLPDGSGLAPLRGSVKGPVQVGKEPAPRDAAPAEPGVPASGPR